MRKMRPQKQLLQLVMLSLLSVVSVLVTSDESFAALACYSCHGQAGDMRPLDTPNGSAITYRNITTGAVKGNHSEHMAATMDPAMCNRCHNNSGYTSSHRSGTISLKKGMNFSASGTYSSPNLTDAGTYVFKNQTSVPTLGTCSNVNCHFEKVTPTWGADTTATTCDTCHSSSPTSGSHTHHINQYTLALGSAAATCVKCHAPRASFQHATSAGNAGRTIDLTNIGGTYTGGNGQYLPSQSATRQFGSCNTIYCHSSGQSATGTSVTPQSFGSPQWNNMGSGSCGTCHEVNLINTGSHGKHVAADNNCGNCHNGATAATMNSANHVNGFINVSGNLNVKYLQGRQSARGNGYDKCSNAVCHAPTTAAPLLTPTWGSAANCASCHDLVPATGSHSKHISAPNNAACGSCHTGAVIGSNGGANHINGTVSVAGGYDGGEIAKHAPGSGYTRCSTATCHDNGKGVPSPSPTWGVSAPACTACHALVPGDSHTKHVSTTLYTKSACGDCHAGAIQGSNAGTAHLNGSVDVSVGGYPKPKAKGSAFASCATAYCHSSGQSANGTGTIPVYTTVTWGGTVTCGTCHVITTMSTGSHTKHLAASTNCGNCHTDATATTYASNNHVNGTISVGGTTPVGYSQGAEHAPGNGYGSCSTASCHANVYGSGSTPTPTWGAATAACTACHTGTGAFSAPGLSPATGTHSKHMSRGNIACANCHAGAVAGVSGGSNHMNGTISLAVDGNPTSVAKHAAGSGYSTCAASCHNGPLFTAPAVTWGASLGCTGCHGYPPALNHGANPGSCNSCHSNVATDGTTFVDRSLHMNRIVEGGRCDACHGYPPVQSVAGLGTNANYSSAKLQNYSGGGGVHNVAGHLALTVKASQFQGTDGFTPCLTCHPKGITHNQGNSTFLTANVQVVVDTQYKFDKNRPIVYNAKQTGTGKTSGNCTNVACHFQKSPVWSSQPYTQGH